MKNELFHALQPMLESGDHQLVDTIKGLDWRLEKSAPGVAVCYNLNPGEEAEKKLLERLKTAPSGILILNRAPTKTLTLPHLIVKDKWWTKAQSVLCDHFFPLPSTKMIGVTGTNGKTTTVDLVLQIGEALGKRGISIGTLGVRRHGKTLEEFGLTTPGQIQLRQMIHHYGDGLDFIAMEVSSHALDQDRVMGIGFDAAAWTSFTQDHLDYHKSMEEYFSSKQKIFRYLNSHGSLYVPAGQKEILQRIGSEKKVEALALLSGDIQKRLSPFFKTHFNQENLALAVGLVEVLGITPGQIPYEKLQPPPGRFYTREWDGRMAVVDFAHTPDALENILKAVRESLPQYRLVALFGCGGDRDRTKRPLMGKIAQEWAHQVIITSDNPRFEDPTRIIDDIKGGMTDMSHVTVTVDRKVAVREALKNLSRGEILVLAGKGHEDYILVKDQKLHYSDVEEVDMFVEQQKDKR